MTPRPLQTESQRSGLNRRPRAINHAQQAAEGNRYIESAGRGSNHNRPECTTNRANETLQNVVASPPSLSVYVDGATLDAAIALAGGVPELEALLTERIALASLRMLEGDR